MERRSPAAKTWKGQIGADLKKLQVAKAISEILADVQNDLAPTKATRSANFGGELSLKTPCFESFV